MIDIDQQQYELNDRINVWFPRNSGYELSYSDGDETENNILRVIKEAKDKSLFSPELRAAISDWPTLYHFSPKRANLLRPIICHVKGDVLEVGAGCGALTRFLGEEQLDVLALEGSSRRCEIIAERCTDLENVTVICQNFEELDPDIYFDTIIYVGVLEYSRLYLSGSSALDQCDFALQLAKNRLRPGGKLILAIENQLGLKYLAGFNEDHVGEPFFGIEDQYKSDGVVTFGKHELGSKLNEHFSSQKWWFPFPDYKLPQSIISSEALKLGSRFDPMSLCSASVFTDAQRPAAMTFALQRAWDPVIRNGLLDHLSNSFLVVASDEELIDNNILAHHFSTDRKPQYNKVVRFENVEGEVAVIREPLLAVPRSEGVIAFGTERYWNGKLWHDVLLGIVVRRYWSLAQITDWAASWWKVVQTKSDQFDLGPLVNAYSLLPGAMIDAIPRNLMETDVGFVFIDQEWIVPNDITAGYLLYRGLFNSLGAIPTCNEPSGEVPHVIDQLIIEVASGIGCSISVDDVIFFKNKELEFIDSVVGLASIEHQVFGGVNLNISKKLNQITDLHTKSIKLENSLADLENKLSVIRDIIGS